MDVEDLPFNVRTILGRANLPMKAYLGLQVGDILLLDHKAGDPLTLKVAETEAFTATPGLFETRKAVKIHERLHP